MKQQRRRLTSMEYHPGILINQIPVEGIPGLLFLAATLFMLLAAVPATRDFLMITWGAGIIWAGGLYYWRNQTRW
jgi:hypothetical protein